MEQLTRTDIQIRALQAIVNHLIDGQGIWIPHKAATAVLGTGVGKSKLSMDFIQYYLKHFEFPEDFNILILVDNSLLRDTNWEQGFIDWGYKEVFDRYVTIECYQTVYKWQDTHFSLVIADEVDFAITGEYFKYFQNNTWNTLLALTGTLPDDKEAILAEFSPVVFRYSSNDAQEDGVLNKTKLIFVKYVLSNDPKSVTINTTTKNFKQSENKYYAYIQEKIEGYKSELYDLKNDPFNMIGGCNDSNIKSLEVKKFYTEKKRTEFLYAHKSSHLIVKNLIAGILEKSEGRIILFSKRNSNLDAIRPESAFHQDISKPKRVELLKRFINGDERVLGVNKKINRGANLPDVSNIILHSFTSSWVDFSQQHGRGLRLDPNKVLNFYVLLPYYLKPVNNEYRLCETQAVTWAKNMLSKFNLKDIEIYEHEQGRALAVSADKGSCS